MALIPGTRLGPYTIEAPIGAGGMGEVYRARDTKLNRDVAIKVLPELFAQDRERLMRFEREAQTLASLNHPNVAQVHGVFEDPAALVMELVDGEDLADRLLRGPMPLDEALPIAKQIAEALEAAHDAGIIHRDLKPANIKVRPDGAVKVLDFGLAKAMDPPSSVAQAIRPAGAMENSPTFTSPVRLRQGYGEAGTEMGIVLGTAPYMAPEQAKGKPVDRRADLWALGCVLFEMLAGRRAFPGDDVTETLATILKSDPDWTQLPVDTPPPIRRLLRRCLQKDPRLRLRDAGSAALEIREALDGVDVGDSISARSGTATTPGRNRTALMATVAMLTLVLAGVWSWGLLRPSAVPREVDKLTVALQSRDELPRSAGHILAVSPDGRSLAYTVLRDRQRVILRRSLDDFDSAPIAGTEEARDPFFSPDGQWLGVTRQNLLMKVPVGGGSPVPIVQLPSTIRGADWLPDGRILLGTNGPHGLLEVPAAGGSISTVYKPDGRVWHPQLLPDGHTVLFTLIPPPGRRDPNLTAPIRFAGELHLLDRRTGQARRLLEDATAGRLLTTGHLVFERDDAIWAVLFDVGRLELRGTPARVVPGVRVEGGRATQMAVAPNGTLVYVRGVPQGASQKRLVWIDRSQRQEILRVPARDYIGLSLSPDGARAAVQAIEGEGADIWVTELALGTLTRISNSGSGEDPLWSRDGRSLVFSSRQDGKWHLFRKSADGTGEAESLASFEPPVNRAQATAWLPDGSLLVEIATRDDEGDIGVLPMTGERVWRPLVRTPNFEGHSALSPDGRWLAYGSDESGETQVYIQPFPGPAPRQQVPGPGWSPAWTRSGTELVYLAGGPPRYVMRLDVQPGRAGDRLTIGTPESLADFVFFDRRTTSRFYGALASGERLLFISRGEAAGDDEGQLRIVLNWIEELRRLVPVN